MQKIGIRELRVFTDYNVHMGGVDKSDQMIGKKKDLDALVNLRNFFLPHFRYCQSKLLYYASGIQVRVNMQKHQRGLNIIHSLISILELIRELSRKSKNMKVSLFVRNPTATDKQPVQSAPSENTQKLFQMLQIRKGRKKGSRILFDL